METYGGGLDDLVSEAFRHGLETTEGRLLGVLDDVVKGLVYSSEWGNINGLSSDNTTGSDTGGVFTWATVSNSLNENLDWVKSGEEVDQLHGLFHSSDSQLLLTVVASS